MAWFIVESRVEHSPPNGWVEAEEVAAFMNEAEARDFAAKRTERTGKPHEVAPLGDWSQCPCCGWMPDSRG